MVHVLEGHEKAAKKCIEETLKTFPQFLPDKWYIETWNETNCMKMHSKSPVAVGGFDVHCQYPFDDVKDIQSNGTIGCLFQSNDGKIYAATCYHVVANADECTSSVPFKTTVDGVKKEFSKRIGLHKLDSTVDIALLPLTESCGVFNGFEHDECKVYDGKIIKKEVQKNGAQTGLTKGKVISEGYNGVIIEEVWVKKKVQSTCDQTGLTKEEIIYTLVKRERSCKNLILVGVPSNGTVLPFSEKGDSGSIVTLCRKGGEKTHKAVSMVLGGDMNLPKTGFIASGTFSLHEAMQSLKIDTNYVILSKLGSKTLDKSKENSKNVKYLASTSKIFHLKSNNTSNYPLFVHFVFVVYVLKTVGEKIHSGTEASDRPAVLGESKDEGNTNEVCRENSKTKNISYIYT